MIIEPKDWLVTLRQMEGIGYQTLSILLPYLESLPSTLSRLGEYIPPLPSLPLRKMEKIRQLNRNEVIQCKQALLQKNIQSMTLLDEDFPPYLREIADPPFVLYAIGNLKLLENPMLGIVGTRNPTNYGKQIALHLGSDLARAGFTIVSGMARGIDSEAHKGALSAHEGTVAVLGCGVDVLYPSENHRLYQEMAARGLLLSEYVPGTRPHTRLFPQRNRIISGLSLGIIVVEAAAKSGSLITVDHASEQGRDVFAIPGSILSPLSQGVNGLLKDGAIPVTNIADIVKHYSHLNLNLGNQNKKKEHLTVNERQILDMIENTQITIDQIVAITSLPVKEVLSGLLSLQLKGEIHQLPGCIFMKAK